jgi:titin
VISGNTFHGVSVNDSGTSNNVVVGNRIGTNPAGTAAIANSGAGVQLTASSQGNIVGGFTANARNLISGNVSQGVVISGASSNNRIAGNFIGTNAVGAAAIPNGGGGVDIFGAATGNIIGGTEHGAGNLISGNTGRGVTISGVGTASNAVAANIIGMNAAGTAALANIGAGVAVFNSSTGNKIGVPNGGRNYIGGNMAMGVQISGSASTGNLIQNNSIGVSPTGALIGNTGATGAGIQIFNGASSNLVGGAVPGAANLIAGNAQGGVEIYDTASRNTISGNSIGSNGALGIDLQGGTQSARVTANDASDTDTGANALQNYPTLISAVLGLGTTVNGTLHSAASATFRIEFFASTSADATGYGEAQNFVGAIQITTNASGNTTFSAALTACVPAGQFISATATDGNGNTSELAQNVIVTTNDSDSDGLPDAYETASGLNTSVADATSDRDADGLSNLAEFRAGTDPNDSASRLRLLPASLSATGFQFSLPTVLDRTYRLEYAEAIAAPTAWRIFADQVIGTGNAIPFSDPAAATLPQRYYRALIVP